MTLMCMFSDLSLAVLSRGLNARARYRDEPPSLVQFSASREGSGPIAHPRDNDRPASGSTTPNTSELVYATPDEDQRNERVAHAMKLLLAARDRVLTLSEQRVCMALLSSFVVCTLIHFLSPATRAHDPSTYFNPHDNLPRPRPHRLAQPLHRAPSLPLPH
jgi:hypothetical protein